MFDVAVIMRSTEKRTIGIYETRRNCYHGISSANLTVAVDGPLNADIPPEPSVVSCPLRIRIIRFDAIICS